MDTNNHFNPINRLLRFCRLESACIFLLLLSTPSWAETFYKWQNDNGSWVYGAHPPADKEAIEIKTTVGRASAVPVDSEEGDAEDPVAAQGGTLEYTVEEENKLSRQQKSEFCKTARDNLEALNSKAVIRRRDENGDVQVVSDQERQDEIDKAKLAIKEYC